MELLAIAFALCSIYLLQLQLFHFDSGKTKHMVLWLLILCGFGIYAPCSICYLVKWVLSAVLFSFLLL